MLVSLPIGVRCPVFPNDDKRDRLIDSEGEDEEDTTGILARYDANTRIKLLRIKDKVNRLTGLGVRSALIPQDDDINVYPLGEKNILPILEDREMKRLILLVFVCLLRQVDVMCGSCSHIFSFYIVCVLIIYYFCKLQNERGNVGPRGTSYRT